MLEPNVAIPAALIGNQTQTTSIFNSIATRESGAWRIASETPGLRMRSLHAIDSTADFKQVENKPRRFARYEISLKQEAMCRTDWDL